MTAAERINAASQRLANAETAVREARGDLEGAAHAAGAAPSPERYDALSVAAREVADAMRRVGFFRVDLARITASEHDALA